MEILNDRKYSPKHTWAKLDGEYAYIGVTDFAQDQLGEVLYVDVPEVEDELTKDSDFGVIESSKVASELIAPISGEVVEVNDEKLEDEPEFVNEAPYDAWICKIKVADMAEYEALLTAEQYEATLAE
ncbi:MAG: glycine cleavage system protein GcvH [Clostridiales bacterium]|jgi:glycine cleavage system H protein|uniref:glycine cleavage system protein GcvH n=1 Tax=Clostridia TaxID=186801 RepID=UPI0018A8E6F7|nr:glycine cleavage system protein GcvH [Clostridium sp. 1001270J_160509_D11]MDU1203581.1 glycine cleavage system protein GcvH [Clostridiales bacterium]